MPDLKPTYAFERHPQQHLTSGRLLARNTIWSLGANIASIVIALISVPILIRHLGVARFGVIGLAWVVEGQFSLFNLGLGRALTKLVAENLGMSKERNIPPLFWSSLSLMFVFGAIGALILKIISPWLVHSILKIPSAIQTETLNSFYLVALSLPLVISSSGLRGFLEACQRFDLLSAVRVPISLFSYLAPLLVLPFTKSVAPVIAVLVASRCMAWAIHLTLCFRVWPELHRNITMRGAPISRMFHFGGWMTITNIVSPIMVNLDRFMIGALISITAVTYYVTPYEAVTKLWIVPSAISGVLFPAFSHAVANDRERAALLFDRGIKYTFLALFPILVGCLALGHVILQIWLGSAFAQKSTIVLQLLACGVFVNSLAQIAFWQIQGAGRPDLTAKVHLIELPLYLAIFVFLTLHFGIEGAAIAWVIRAATDAVVMFWYSGSLLPECFPAIRRLGWMVVAGIPVCIIGGCVKGNGAALIFLAVSWTGCLIITWFRLLTPHERAVARNLRILFTAV